ncbi:hypothetical protein GCM10010174_82470 [Kutzneria viridogrisea]|uniref:Uncharacterized protein n=1 Tax=Kutzneria viridogrisea TaxID=47990 RepID=A0ABR6BEL5_9PSEU|nr:hypothetical protein [Kutzneria viridogrisea]
MSTDSLTAHLYRLTDALLVWEGRDDTKAQPGVRQAANIAVDSIDALLHELHELRGSLLAEIRASDDASAARVDALLHSREAQP